MMSSMNDSPAVSDQEPEASPFGWWRTHSRRVWLVVRIAIALVVVAAGLWWMMLSPVKITTHPVTTGMVSAEVMGTGTLEARVTATVGPKMTGLVTEVAVDQGDRVKRGDTLIELEDADYIHQVGVAQADVAVAVAAIDRLEAEKHRAQAVLSMAQLTHQRQEQAAAASASSQQELARTAEALAVAQAELTRAQAAIAEGQRRRVAAEQMLDFQRARLSDTTIQAPFDALVIRRDRDSGDVVTAGSSVLQLASLDEMWITAWVDETQLARLSPGQAARVVFRSEPGVEYPGVVARLGRETDRETREIVVDVRLDRLPDTWALGQRAEVYIGVERKEDVTVLPAELLLRRPGEMGVMVDEDGRARWRSVSVGLHGRDSVEITSGLRPGDIVVSPAKAGAALREGRRISAQ